MKRIFIAVSLTFMLASISIPALSETLNVLIKGVDDGVKTNKQQDYNEAVMNAKLQAIERAGVAIHSITQVVNFQTKFDMVESKAKAILLPGFQIMDMGYQTDGSYQVVLSGKVAVGKGKPQKSPKSLLNMATREKIKGNRHYSEQRYEEGKAHYQKALQLYNTILKSFPGSDEALQIERESMIENLEPKTLAEIVRDGRFIAPGDGTVLDTKTGLMWAAKDNGRGINWHDAKRYCENYRGGGYTDWRMPALDELEDLYDRSRSYHHKQSSFSVHLTELIQLTDCCPWASETDGSKAAHFNFVIGERIWHYESHSPYNPALPVRAGN